MYPEDPLRDYIDAHKEFREHVQEGFKKLLSDLTKEWVRGLVRDMQKRQENRTKSIKVVKAKPPKVVVAAPAPKRMRRPQHKG